MQTCLICGPDVDCKGHPQKTRRMKPSVDKLVIPKGACPACVAFGKKIHAPKSRHLLQSPREVSDALRVGPVFCYPNRNNRRKLDWQQVFNVRNTRTKDGCFQIELLEGWFDRSEIGELWMNADTSIKVAA